MNKKLLIVDFDDTIVDSRKTICDYYIYKYKTFDGYTEPKYEQLRANDYKDQCPLFETRFDLLNAFNSDFYFERVKLFEGAKDVLKLLLNAYDIKICTLGMKENIEKKLIYVDKHLNFIGSENVIGLVHNGGVIDKSTIDMSGAVFIDDKYKNLISSNAKLKVCFGVEAECNEQWQGLRVLNWQEIAYLLLR